MKTKEPVRVICCALALSITTLARAADSEVALTGLLDECAAAEADCAMSACESCVDCSDGSTRTPFWFAGTEVTVLNVDARSGGRITASFTDTTAPGVARRRLSTATA